MEKIKYIKASEGGITERVNTKAIIRGVLLTTILCLLLIMVFAVVFTYSDFNVKYIGFVSKVIYFAGAAMCGVFSSLGARKGGWLLGGIAGLIYSVLFCLLGMLTADIYNLNVGILKKVILSLLFGIVGGIVGINIKLKKSK